MGIDPAPSAHPGRGRFVVVSFATGAVIPLVPWFVTSGMTAIVASLVLAVAAAVVVGAAVARFADGRRGRHRAPGAVHRDPALITYAIGSAIGVSI